MSPSAPAPWDHSSPTGAAGGGLPGSPEQVQLMDTGEDDRGWQQVLRGRGGGVRPGGGWRLTSPEQHRSSRESPGGRSPYPRASRRPTALHGYGGPCVWGLATPQQVRWGGPGRWEG